MQLAGDIRPNPGLRQLKAEKYVLTVPSGAPGSLR